ncbi:MAG: MaoC/PaaZ C-terminal domain-containing protein [Solirubrobacterales bacterium]
MSPPDSLKPAVEAIGLELGTRRLSYDEDDAILYALAVGAAAADLDLVFERDLRVLPTFGLTRALWALDELGGLGFFSSVNALHAGQRLEVLEPLPPAGELELSGRVSAVWDKGSAALFEVEVRCRQFRSVASVFAPGQGGWGGERGPSARRDPERPPSRRTSVRTAPDQAALYRLTGDKHLIHVDPAAAEAIGVPRPILHGLCTLGLSVRELAGLFGAHPADLTALECRFLAPVLPGERLEVSAWDPAGAGDPVSFSVLSAGAVAIGGGSAAFG